MKVGKINSRFISESYRFNSDFHLSEGVAFDRTIRMKEYKLLSSVCDEIFCAGRSKRIYVESASGIPYLGNTNISSTNPLANCKYTSRKFWNDSKGFIVPGMILTGRVGQNTVGAFSYTNKELNEAIGSDNVIRLVGNNKVENGYLYAFLASKYGFYLSRRHISGNAQPFITEDMLGNIPVPILSREIQINTNKLILESSELRTESNLLLKKAELLFNDLNNLEYPLELLAPSENKVQLGYIVKKNDLFLKTIKARNYSLRANKLIDIWGSKIGITLNQYLASAFQMGARASFKRIDSPNFKGEDLISQGDIHQQNPKTFKQVKVKKVTAEDKAQRASLIMPSAGTLGESEIFTRPLLVRNNFEDKLLSEVIGKFKCKNEIDAAYLYTALSSKAGFRILRAMVYGTNLLYPNWELIKNINIPVINDDAKLRIAELVIKAFDKKGLANKMENQAIYIIEKEIESWQ